MTLQAMAIGFDCHQFRAFDRDAVAQEFGVLRKWEVTSMTACGVSSEGSRGGNDLGATTVRRTRDAITWARCPPGR